MFFSLFIVSQWLSLSLGMSQLFSTCYLFTYCLKLFSGKIRTRLKSSGRCKKSFSHITTWGEYLAIGLMKIVLTLSIFHKIIRQLPVYMDINSKQKYCYRQSLFFFLLQLKQKETNGKTKPKKENILQGTEVIISTKRQTVFTINLSA